MEDNNGPELRDAIEAPAPGSCEFVNDRRTQRIDDYASAALQELDPLAANVATLNADLMELAYVFKQSLGKFVEHPVEDVGAVFAALPAVEQYLKMVKQISSLTQLGIKLRQLNRSEAMNP